MKSFASAATFLALLAASIILTPTLGTATALPTAWPHEKSDLNPDPKITYGILDNGLRYAVMPNQTPEKQASVRLLIDVGSKHEYDDERGMAHFIEHMAFNGSANVAEGEMIKMLERHGLAFGADANAYTSYEQTVYQLDLPNMKTETIDTVLMLMRETAGNLTFDIDAIERERSVILAEKRRTNIHAQRTADARLAFSYPGTRMLERRPIGTEAGISSVTREQMVRFYQQFYRPENAFLVIVGDFTLGEMDTKIKAVFSNWQSVGEPRDTRYTADPAIFKTNKPLAQHFVNEKDRTSLSILLSTNYREQDDNSKVRIKSLWEYAGNALLNNRLQNLRLDGKAAYLGAGASISNFNKIARSAYLGLFLEEDKWEAGLEDAITELNRALAYGFTHDELSELLANLRTSFEYGVSTADKRQSAGLANGILGSFAADRVFTGPQTSLDIFNRFAETSTIEGISTEFATQWANIPPKLFFLSKKPLENIEEKLLAIYADSLSAIVAKPIKAAIQTFAYTDFGTPGAIADRNTLDDLDVTTIRFANNVMLNLKKTDLQTDTVQMALRFGSGMLTAPKDEPGMMTLLGGTFTNGGLEAHSATDLRKILAGKTATASMATGTDTFAFRSAVTPGDQLIQLQLWAAYMTAPAYRNEAIKFYQQSIEALYHALDNTPGQVAAYRVGKYLYSGDPRFYLPSKASIQRLKRPDIHAFMKDTLAGSSIEISIVGDIDIEASIKAVAQTFGALPQRETLPRRYDEARKVAFPAPGRETLYHKGGEDQAILRIYWPTVDFSNVARSARLDLLSAVLNDRIREAVREGLGTSYAPGINNLEHDIFPGYGYISLSVDAKPSDIKRITSLVTKEVGRLIKEGITEDELERARRPMLESIENAAQNNLHWIDRISTAQSNPDSLTYLAVAVNVWKNAVPDELRKLAEHYLLAENALEIHILPTPTETVGTSKPVLP